MYYKRAICRNEANKCKKPNYVLLKIQIHYILLSLAMLDVWMTTFGLTGRLAQGEEGRRDILQNKNKSVRSS